jgi:hypothetical protein
MILAWSLSMVRGSLPLALCSFRRPTERKIDEPVYEPRGIADEEQKIIASP